MLRLRKYLKPYLIMILLAIVLLFAQANFDLALPDYLSRIVNVGIQQAGVENAVPIAVRESTMDKLILFMDEAERALVSESYTLVEPSSSEAAELIEDYPALEDEVIYVLEDITQEEMDALDSIMGKSLMIVPL